MNERRRGAVCGLLAAASFGVSVPLAKRLLGELEPQLLAGLLYLGAALALWGRRALGRSSSEARLRREDGPSLALLVVSGGIVAPVLMLMGLARVSGLAGSLLLNLEAPLTMALALALFGEHIGRGAAIAAALIVGGAALLKLEPGAFVADWSGGLLIAAACACWALDNNLTQRLSLRDPFALVRIKTLAAGACNLALSLARREGSATPAPRTVLLALGLGALSYGASVVLDAYALRLVGAVREAAYFATAPFLGALFALGLGDRLGAWDAAAMAAMALGVALLWRERHDHQHAHEALDHEHAHVHDEHHRHEHGPGDPPGEPHAHRHRHEPMVHAHPHVPDAHHRHRH